MLAKFAYPSIEYVLATAHYPEEFRREARQYPTFFPAPPVQVFHVAWGHFPIFVPLPRQSTSGQRAPKPRIVRYRVKSKPHERPMLERIVDPSSKQGLSRQLLDRHVSTASEPAVSPPPIASTSSESCSESELTGDTTSQSTSDDEVEEVITPVPSRSGKDPLKEAKISATYFA